MSKPIEKMTLTELRQYMSEHRHSNREWERAYDLFRQKADWNKVPSGSTPEQEKQIIKDLIAKKAN